MISFTRSLLNELQAMRLLAKNSATTPYIDIDIGTSRDAKRVLILGGYGSIPRAYTDLARYLRLLDCRVEVADFGWMNINSLKRQTDLLMKNVTEFLQRHDRIDYVIGQSLGGIEAVALLPMFSDIKHVVALGSPFNSGTPWRIVELGASLSLAPLPMTKDLLGRIVASARPLASKITTVGSVYDLIVPPSHAMFPDANNIIIDENIARADMVCSSHCGLPNSWFVRESVIRPIIEME
jgi:hypothetical protein